MKTFKYFIREEDHPAVRAFAAAAHEEWRRSLPPDKQNEPRIRSKNGGPEADINVPFHQLHPTAQQENLAAGHAAKEAVEKHPHDDEKAAEHIHKEWMKRNPKDNNNAAQHVPYKDLPENEKEKDRVHVRTMRSLLKSHISEACWKGYKQVGGKMKNGKMVPNCVPVKEAANAAQQAAIAIAMKKAGKKPKNEEVEQIEEEEARRPTDAEYEHAKKQVQKTFGNDRRIHAIGVIGDRIHLKHGTKNATDMKGVSMRLPEEVEQLDERGEDSKGYKRSTESGAGLTRKGAKHFGIKTAVTTPPSKLDPNGKAAKRRKSFCARMSGMRGPMKDEKGRPTRKAMSLRRWHCEE